MGFFKNLFTWWEGASTGTRCSARATAARSARTRSAIVHAVEKGPSLGDVQGLERRQPGAARMVCLADPADRRRARRGAAAAAQFLKPAAPNLTGTAQAYRPTGALERGGHRQAASGDYQAWTPD
jgi:hypothetical protein